MRVLLNGTALGLVTLLLALSSTLALENAPRVPASLQTPSDESIPTRDRNPKRLLYDNADILTGKQAQRLDFDLGRLYDVGVQVVVFTRVSNDLRGESVTFADRLRQDWGVESSPGANNGIVMLVTISETFPLNDSLVMSLGPSALPIGQLDTPTLQEIDDQEMQPAFRRNEINLALSYGVRRILYSQNYTPPSPPPLSARQEQARDLAAWSLLMTTVVAVAGVILVPAWNRGQRQRSFPLRSRNVYGGIVGLLLLLSAGLSLYGRSALWLVISCLGGVALLLGFRVVLAWRGWRQGKPKAFRVRPRTIQLRHRQPAFRHERGGTRHV